MRDIIHPKNVNNRIVDTRNKVKTNQAQPIIDKVEVKNFTVDKVKRSNGSKIIKWFIVLIVILLVLAGSYYYFLIKDNNSSKSETSTTSDLQDEELREIDSSLNDLEDSVNNLDNDPDDKDVPVLDFNVTL